MQRIKELQKLISDIRAKKFTSVSSAIQKKISELAPLQISMIFDFIETSRLITGENIGENYTAAELSAAYDLVIPKKQSKVNAELSLQAANSAITEVRSFIHSLPENIDLSTDSELQEFIALSQKLNALRNRIIPNLQKLQNKAIKKGLSVELGTLDKDDVIIEKPKDYEAVQEAWNQAVYRLPELEQLINEYSNNNSIDIQKKLIEKLLENVETIKAIKLNDTNLFDRLLEEVDHNIQLKENMLNILKILIEDHINLLKPPPTKAIPSASQYIAMLDEEAKELHRHKAALKKESKQIRDLEQYKRYIDPNVIVRIHSLPGGGIGVDQGIVNPKARNQDSVTIVGRGKVSGGKGSQMRHVTPVMFAEHLIKNSISEALSDDDPEVVNNLIKKFLHDIDHFIDVRETGYVLLPSELKKLKLPRKVTKTFSELEATHLGILVSEDALNEIMSKKENKDILKNITSEEYKERLEQWNNEKKEIIITNIFETYKRYLENGNKSGVEYLGELILTEFNRHSNAAFPEEGNNRKSYEIRVYNKNDHSKKKSFQVIQDLDELAKVDPKLFTIRIVDVEGPGIKNVAKILRSANTKLKDKLLNDKKEQQDTVENIAKELFETFDYKKLEKSILHEIDDPSQAKSGERIIQAFKGVNGRKAKCYVIRDGTTVRAQEKDIALAERLYDDTVQWRSDMKEPNIGLLSLLTSRQLDLVFLAYPYLNNLHHEIVEEFVRLVATNHEIDKNELLDLTENKLKELHPVEYDSLYVSSDSSNMTPLNTPTKSESATARLEYEEFVAGLWDSPIPNKGLTNISSADTSFTLSTPGVASLNDSKYESKHKNDDDENLRRKEKSDLVINQNNTNEQVSKDQPPRLVFNFKAELCKGLSEVEQARINSFMVEAEEILQKDDYEKVTTPETPNHKPTVEILPETSHQKLHKDNVEQLIKLIDSNGIKPGTVICIERKQYGNNLGMADVILLAKVLQNNNDPSQDPILLPTILTQSPIYQDALLYNIAKEKNILVLGVEGKGLDDSNKTKYNEAREEYMVAEIGKIVMYGRDVILLVGSSHVDNLTERLKEEGITVQQDLETKLIIPNIEQPRQSLPHKVDTPSMAINVPNQTMVEKFKRSNTSTRSL